MKHKTRSWHLLGGLAAITILFLSACQPTSAELLPTIRYSAFRVADAVYVAQENGFFEKRGINVEFVENPGGTTGIQAVGSGQTEAGGAPIPPLISAIESGLPIIAVGDFQSALPGFPVEEFFVRAGSSISTVADLEGKRIGVNSIGGSFQYTIIYALDQAGVDVEDVEFVVLPFDQQLVSLVSGNVDLIGLIPPYSTQAKAEFSEEVTLFFDALDIFGPKQFVVYTLNSNWANENPDLARAFVGGIADAVIWIHDNPEETKELMADYTGLDVEYMPTFRYQEYGQVVLDDIEFWLDFLEKYGIEISIDLSPEDIGTNMFNPYLTE